MTSAPGVIPFLRMDWAWFYPAGTICNLECRHCLVSSGPHSNVLLPLSVDELAAGLDEVSEQSAGQPYQIGLTGGEVFVLKSAAYGRRLFPMVERALDHGDVLILTNGLLADASTLDRLAEIAAGAKYSLRYRISLDGPTPEENDRFRVSGAGFPTFHKILASLRRFADLGLSHTVAYTYEGSGSGSEVLARKAERERAFAESFEAEGLGEIELWGIPFFEQGSERVRRLDDGLAPSLPPRITGDCLTRFAGGDPERFQCSYSRAFAKESDGQTGWYRCAILCSRTFDVGLFGDVGLSDACEGASARLATHLAEAATDMSLEHEQCFTCFAAATHGSGMSCSG